MRQKHDLTLYFPEGPHSQRVAEDVMADLYPAFVFLLPLCHLLSYQRPSSRGVLDVPACLPVGRAEGRGTSLTQQDPTDENTHCQICRECL